MYIFFSIFLIVAILCSIIFHWYKKKIICKICKMCTCDKYELLNELIEPFGFEYDLSQDIFTSRIDAMQRTFGYTALYNNGAVFFNMVFDCEPIYFDYDGRSWLIQFWKGQYGINIGAEVGIYCTDHIVPVNKRRSTLYFSVDNDNLFPTAIQLFHNDEPVCFLHKEHWWLTVFSMGRFAKPKTLSVKLAITFPTEEMLDAFSTALREVGYTDDEFFTSEGTAYIRFNKGHSKCPCRNYRFIRWLSGVENRIFCKLYRWFTRPFSHTMDRLLLLYFHIPFAFRHMCKPRIYKNRGRR